MGTSLPVWRSVFKVLFKQVLNKEVINENIGLGKSILYTVIFYSICEMSCSYLKIVQLMIDVCQI